MVASHPKVLTRLVALLGALFLFGGCASFSPKSIGAKPQPVTPAWSGPVRVVPLKMDNAMSKLYVMAKAQEIDMLVGTGRSFQASIDAMGHSYAEIAESALELALDGNKKHVNMR